MSCFVSGFGLRLVIQRRLIRQMIHRGGRKIFHAFAELRRVRGLKNHLLLIEEGGRRVGLMCFQLFRARMC